MDGNVDPTVGFSLGVLFVGLVAAFGWRQLGDEWRDLTSWLKSWRKRSTERRRRIFDDIVMEILFFLAVGAGILWGWLGAVVVFVGGLIALSAFWYFRVRNS